MQIAIDLGGSTIDIIRYDRNDSFVHLASFESAHTDKSDVIAILQATGIDRKNVEKIALTGGHSRIFENTLENIPIVKIDEIAAIGAGGSVLSGETSALVCSLGTGTCCVSLRNGKSRHVGGTGVGGGSLLGMCRTILQTDTFGEIRELIANGDARAVDLSVAEIVGGGIGVVPGSATASNFAKASTDSHKTDLARGIANLVGQTVASIAVFAARAEKHDVIVLGGKLVRVPEIVEIVEKTAAIYARKIIVPKHAELLSAVGAGSIAFGPSSLERR